MRAGILALTAALLTACPRKTDDAEPVKRVDVSAKDTEPEPVPATEVVPEPQEEPAPE